MKTTGPLTTHAEYLAQCTPEARARLQQIQREVERQVPGAVPCIGYKMPAFRQQRVFFYFAAFKNHVGIYPPVTEDEALISETARFRGPKGNLSFPHGEALPIDLIGRVAKALAVQYSKPPPQEGRPGRPDMEDHMAAQEKVSGPASYFPSIEKNYGHPISHWMQVLQDAGPLKHMGLVNHLKSGHQLGHGHANALVAWFLAQK